MEGVAFEMGPHLQQAVEGPQVCQAKENEQIKA